MKPIMTVDQLKTLRARWRENEAGFIAFANLVWSSYPLHSPIGRLLDTTPIRYDRANTCLTDAIYDAGGQDFEEDGWRRAFGDYDGRQRNKPYSPIAAAVTTHWRQICDERSNRRIRVPLRPDVLADATAYARERVAILIEVDKALAGHVAKGLRAWRRLLGLLEAERENIAA
jgi:hypothetical protein